MRGKNTTCSTRMQRVACCGLQAPVLGTSASCLAHCAGVRLQLALVQCCAVRVPKCAGVSTAEDAAPDDIRVDLASRSAQQVENHQSQFVVLTTTKSLFLRNGGDWRSLSFLMYLYPQWKRYAVFGGVAERRSFSLQPLLLDSGKARHASGTARP